MTAPTQRPIDYAHYLPWTRLLRSFRIATDPRKLALAALAITLFWCGDRALTFLPFTPDQTARLAPERPDSLLPPWDAVRPTLLIDWDGAAEPDAAAEPGGGTPTLDDAPRSRALTLGQRILSPLDPLLGVAGLPFGEVQPWTEIAFLWTRLLWSFAVWALFGGAIARIAAVEFARDERVSIRAALTFAARRFVSLFSAPLLPLLGVLGLWAVCAFGGLVGRIPYAGEWAVALFWGLAALVGLLLVLVLIATAVGWPLMVVAVAAEGSDAFDGFSRSFSYLYGRPWLFVWYAGLALLLGPLLVAAVDTIAVGVAAVAARAVGTGMGGNSVAALHDAAPAYFGSTRIYPFDTPVAATGPAVLTAVWLRTLATLAVAFATSYFWTAATIVYFLLRRADDATHFDDVWLDDKDEDDDLLPLAGIASTGQPVTERSHHPTVGPPVATS